jgi:hypothetical protein
MERRPVHNNKAGGGCAATRRSKFNPRVKANSRHVGVRRARLHFFKRKKSYKDCEQFFVV